MKHNPWNHYVDPEAVRTAMRAARTGQKHSDATKQKIGDKRRGQKHTQDAIDKIRQAKAAQPRMTCEHCGKTNLTPQTYGRWHGLNCKEYKPDAVQDD